MIPHNMTLFKFICVQYQFHRQTLPIMKIDRGQIQFRDYVSTGTEPTHGSCVKDPQIVLIIVADPVRIPISVIPLYGGTLWRHVQLNYSIYLPTAAVSKILRSYWLSYPTLYVFLYPWSHCTAAHCGGTFPVVSVWPMSVTVPRHPSPPSCSPQVQFWPRTTRIPMSNTIPDNRK